MLTRSPFVPVVIALTMCLAFYVYLSPDRLGSWFDQVDYQDLAGVIAARGVFAHAVPGGLVAEPRRSMGYPLFLSAIVKVAGGAYPPAVAIQAALVAATAVLIYVMARRILSRRSALAAGIACALFPPFAYWSAYTMTETLAIFLVTLGTVVLYLALRRASWSRALFAGAALGYAGLVRPTLALVIIALAVATIVAVRTGRVRGIRLRLILGATLVAAIVGIAPQVAYTWVNFDRPGLTPFTPGFQILLGYWQGVWPGRLSSTIATLAREHASPERIATTAVHLGIAPQRLTRYVGELLTYSDWPGEGPTTFVRANDWAFARATEDIRADPAGYIVRGFTSRLPTLLVGSIPVRYEQIDKLPRVALLAIWGLQAALLGLALVGIIVLLRGPDERVLAGAFVGALLVYMCAVHFPFWTEGRYSLPAWPVLLMAAVVGATSVAAAVQRRSDGPRPSR